MQQKQSHSIIPRENQTLQWSGVNKRAALKDSKSAFLKSKHFKRALSLMFTLISKSNKTGCGDQRKVRYHTMMAQFWVPTQT